MIDLLDIPTIQVIEITDDTSFVDLSDSHTIAVPLAWYLRLLHRSIKERHN